MATTTAKTRQEVDNMSKADRLWDSLSYSYGRKGDMLNKEYDRAYSQADRQALSRGMQRSTYNNQTLANVNENRINALNDNQSALIADYENRLGQLEEQEWQQDFQERQFAENQRQYNENLAWDKEKAATQNAQWQQNFDYGKERDAVADNQWNLNFGYQQERDKVGDERWEKEFGANREDTEKSLAWAYVQTALANGNVPSDDLLAKAGISRADAAMMAAQKSGGGSGNGNGNGDNPYGLTDEEWQAFLDMLNGNNGKKVYDLGRIDPNIGTNSEKEKEKEKVAGGAASGTTGSSSNSLFNKYKK